MYVYYLCILCHVPLLFITKIAHIICMYATAVCVFQYCWRYTKDLWEFACTV